MKFWDKETSKGNLFSVDLLDASDPARTVPFRDRPQRFVCGRLSLSLSLSQTLA